MGREGTCSPQSLPQMLSVADLGLFLPKYAEIVYVQSRSLNKLGNLCRDQLPIAQVQSQAHLSVQRVYLVCEKSTTVLKLTFAAYKCAGKYRSAPGLSKECKAFIRQGLHNSTPPPCRHSAVATTHGAGVRASAWPTVCAGRRACHEAGVSPWLAGMQ